MRNEESTHQEGMNDLTLSLVFFECVRKFKSVNRAFRRGHITDTGYIIPKRPFNNRANTSKRRGVHSRKLTNLKRKVYAELRQRNDN